ncbi:response regulator transcription factor [Actinomadura rugatobispora]|uniref:Response regulator n=1 Tax=Actinomadura rugatobispora TaxID=1994 RepID=A0ABW0ZTG3_9ACTN|nr:response regulator transcription factor [Actinomadura rugatobispora]
MGDPRVMVVDDNIVVRSGLVSLLEAAGIEVVGEAGDGRTALELAERIRPDLVLLDVRMPLMDGISAAGGLSRVAKVVMLTYTQDPGVVQAAIERGAVGYLVHGSFTAAELTAAVHDAMEGANPLSREAVSALVGAVHRDQVQSGTWDGSPVAPPPGHGASQRRARERFGLSAREAEVMELIVRGRTNGEIAERLFLAEKTVKNHINHIYAKLGVASRAGAIAHWLGTAEEQAGPPGGPDGPG